MGRAHPRRFRDRYVNNRILQCLSRPQYKHSCGVTALTCVANYLWPKKLDGIVTQEMLARNLGFSAAAAGDDGGPGNKEMIQWFRKFRAKNNFRGSETVIDGDTFPNLDKLTLEDYESKVEDIKRTIRSQSSIMVYHADNHYNIVCGYFEAAEEPNQAFAENPYLKRWLLLADHLDTWKREEVSPVYGVRFREVVDWLQDDSYGILLFQKRGSWIDWIPRHA